MGKQGEDSLSGGQQRQGGRVQGAEQPARRGSRSPAAEGLAKADSGVRFTEGRLDHCFSDYPRGRTSSVCFIFQSIIDRHAVLTEPDS